MPARGNRAATLAQFKLSPDGEGRSLPVVSVVKPCCCYYYYNSHTHTRIVYAKCGKMLKKEELSTVKRVKQLQNQFACTRKDRERERVWPATDVWAREQEREREKLQKEPEKCYHVYKILRSATSPPSSASVNVSRAERSNFNSCSTVRYRARRVYVCVSVLASY